MQVDEILTSILFDCAHENVIVNIGRKVSRKVNLPARGLVNAVAINSQANVTRSYEQPSIGE